MTPKEKAQELIDKFYDIEYADFYQNNGYSMNWSEIKQCALIAVDEILEATKHEYQIQYESGEWSREIGYKYSEYWKEVKNEIEKL
jgi:hypothetical protein